jgi:CheY-like chemotaxis protein
VHLTVTDSGPGMDSQVRRRLFEPFFSTKFLGRGLGLAAAQGIVRDHGGCIEIESAPGQGTSVHIHLPRSVPPGGARQPAMDGIAQPRTILVIEDEPAVYSLIQRALEMQGHTVVLAKDGEQALGIFDKLVDEIDAVFLDLGLKGIEGKAVLAELRACNPDIPVLVTSSYGIAEAAQDIAIDDKTQFLQKPFSLEELGAKMQAIFATDTT